MGWRTDVKVPEGVGIFFLRHRVHTDSGAHPASSPTGGEFSGKEVKRLRHEAEHSPECSIEVKNAQSFTSTPPYILML